MSSRYNNISRLVALTLGGALAAGAVPLATQERLAGDSAPPAPATRFYDSSEPLTLTFTANIGQLRRDKQDEAPWRAATLAYADSAGATVTLPVRARTRGFWRLKTCSFPPLRLDIPRRRASETVLAGLDRPKLVNYCRDDDRHEQYVLQELQLYRIYNLLTPISHRARLLRVAYVDSASGRTHATRHAFIFEEPDALAARVGGRVLEHKGARSGDLNPNGNALFGVFQFLIGNTDWSVSQLHNVELMATDSGVYPVAYDFDHSGAVNAHYALPPPQLPIKRVRDRLFRGYCAPEEEYTRVFALFNARRDAITALYHDAVGKLMKPRVVEQTLGYIDDFYETINDPGRARRLIVAACLRTE